MMFIMRILWPNTRQQTISDTPITKAGVYYISRRTCHPKKASSWSAAGKRLPIENIAENNSQPSLWLPGSGDRTPLVHRTWHAVFPGECLSLARSIQISRGPLFEFDITSSLWMSPMSSPSKLPTLNDLGTTSGASEHGCANHLRTHEHTLARQ